MISNYSQLIEASRLKLYIDGELQVQDLKHPSKFLKYEHRPRDPCTVEPKRSPIFFKDPLLKNWSTKIQSRLKSYIHGETIIEDLIHPSKISRKSPKKRKSRNKDRFKPNKSTDLDSRSSSQSESKSKVGAQHLLNETIIQKANENTAVDGVSDTFFSNTTHERERRQLDRTSTHTSSLAISTRQTTNVKMEARGGVYPSNSRIATEENQICKRNSESVIIKPTTVTETLDTQCYEMTNDNSRLMARCKMPSNYSQCDDKVDDKYNNQVKKFRNRNRASVLVGIQKPKRREKFELDDQISISDSDKSTAFRMIQMEINIIGERNRNLEVQLQREQVQNDILQLSIQCLKEQAESKIDDITRKFDLLTTELRQAQNESEIVRTDAHQNFVEKQALLQTISRLEEENSQLIGQARYFPKKLKQKLSHITESVTALQQQRSRLIKTLQNSETPCLLDVDMLRIL